MSLKKASRTKSLSLSDDFPIRTPPRTTTTTTAATPATPTPTASGARHLNTAAKRVEDAAKILKYIDDNIIGKGVAFLGPFGRRKVVYADYISSGRSLQFLEDYINKEVLPAYGDINCTSAVTGLQSQLYYKEAKELIRSAVNASADDEIIFSEGNYSSPIERLSYILCAHDNHYDNGAVLFVSTSEPDENLRSWLDAGAQIERISKTREGFLDLVDLEKKLVSYVGSHRRLIGLFSGVSRLTGILADDVATTILLHQYGAISIWDYSSAVQYTSINTNPTLSGAVKDVVFFCANKCIGGAQAPSVVVVKKSLLADRNLSVYDSVGIIGAVRAGLVIQLKESLGAQCIQNRQEKLCKQMLSHIRTIPEIVLLGPLTTSARRFPTLCFLVRHPRGAYLHHRFVVAVLNDVFGIQATSRNAIVEPMGLSNKMIVEYERLLADDSIHMEGMRPGYIQISFPFFMSENEVGFILEALKMVATEAWKLLPQYEIDNVTGEWRHHSNSLIKERKWLGAIRYTDGRMLFSDRRISGPGAFPQNYADCLQTARNLFNRSRKMAQRSSVAENLVLKLDRKNAETLRWYMLPGEAHELLLGHSQNVKHTVPFDPNKVPVPTSILLSIQRHNSLSALDVKRYKTRSLPTSPVHHMPHTSRQHATPSPPIHHTSIPDRLRSSPLHSIRIDRLSPIPVTPPSASISDDGSQNRNRCHSWSSSNGVKFKRSLHATQTTNNGLRLLSPKVPKERLCSCSSQTDLEDLPNIIASAGINLVGGGVGGPPGSDSSHDESEEIKAYVTNVTSELATEIKSEIREVISRVEDVLDSTENLDMSSLNFNSLCTTNSLEDTRNDSVSATDVAEYLKEFSIGITNQVKSEIREIVNVMNENEHHFEYNTRRFSPHELFEKSLSCPAKEKIKHSFSDFASTEEEEEEEEENAPKRCHDVNNDCKQRSESMPNPSLRNSTASSPENSTPSCPYTGAISKLIDPVGTASQDSGINMCFPDSDETKTTNPKAPMTKSFNERMEMYTNNMIDNENRTKSSCKYTTTTTTAKTTAPPQPTTTTTTVAAATTMTRNRDDFKRDSSDSDRERDDSRRWCYLPNPVWKQTAEAMDEFDMIKEGDRVLACLSGSSASLCLLHAIRQYARARGIHVDIGAIALGSIGVDPRALMLYLRDLDVKCIFDQLGPAESLRTKLHHICRRKGYTVLAYGTTLDKLAEEFIISVMNKGRLQCVQAHGFNRDGDLRIVRPFVYVRERQLEDFAIQKDMPSRPSKMLTKPPDASNSILKVQEVANPMVYDNIKNALRPILSARIDSAKPMCYNFFRASSRD